MTRDWILLPFFAALWIFQAAVVNNMLLLSGAADLMLVFLTIWALQPASGRSVWVWGGLAALLADLSSAMPAGSYFFFYFSAIAFAWLLKRRIWQNQIIAAFLSLMLSSLWGYLAFYVLLWIFESAPGGFTESLSLVILPSLFLNLLWAVPLYFLVRDLAAWIYPEELF